MTYINKTAVVIPAYKPDARLATYVNELKSAGVGKIVVIDDGSGEEYARFFESFRQDDQVDLISYSPNAGKGVALKRGLTHVKDNCKSISYIVTADSDGQHTAVDVLRTAEMVSKEEGALVLGTRDFSNPDVPLRSRIGNRTTTVVFRLLYGQWIPDTQTGLRGFDLSLLPLMIDVRGERYEYEMKVLIKCATLKIPMKTLTIETVYENNNECSHFNPIKDSIKIYSVIFKDFFCFTGTSLGSFCFDYGLYLLFNNVFKSIESLDSEFNFLFIHMVSHIFLATLIARVISGTLNYYLNKKLVFHSKTPAIKSFPRYLVVFFTILLLSAYLTSSLHIWFNWDDNAVKIPVDIALFFLSYFIQRKWVFSEKKFNSKVK